MSKNIAPEERGFTSVVGQRVARFRKERGITQVEMAERLGVSQSHVSFIESGVIRLHGELLVKLAQVLDVSADELLGLAPARSRGGAASKGKLWKTFQLVAQLPERDQRAVARLIGSLVAAAHQKKSA